MNKREQRQENFKIFLLLTPWYPTTTTNTWYPTTRTTTWYPTSTTATTVPAGVCPDDWIESLEGCFLFQYTGEVGGVARVF